MDKKLDQIMDEFIVASQQSVVDDLVAAGHLPGLREVALRAEVDLGWYVGDIPGWNDRIAWVKGER